MEVKKRYVCTSSKRILMKNLFLLIFVVASLLSCDKDDDSQTLTVDFSITHDTYTNIQSPFTIIEILSEDGGVLDRKTNLGGNDPTWNTSIDITASGDKTNLTLMAFREGGKSVQANNVTNGSTVTWNTASNTANVSGGGGSGSGGSSIIGKWNQTPQDCTNSSGEGNSFTFGSSSGTVFQADCNSTCTGGGISTSFTYSISGSNITISPTSVSEYCGVEADTPAPFTAPFSINGNILTLDGQDFEKE